MGKGVWLPILLVFWFWSTPAPAVVATTLPTPTVAAEGLLFLPVIGRFAAPPVPTATSTPAPTASPTPTRTPRPTLTALPIATWPTTIASPTSPVVASTVSADTAILGSPRASREQLVAGILARPHGEYTAYDVESIVASYDAACREAGIDPLLAAAQMIHETGNLSSFWAGRPRRNPAGIGVTGLTSSMPPADPASWAFDAQSGLWRYGVSFPSWNAGVRAQVGRLLAYALPAGQGTAAQQALIAEALAWRSLPARLRGSAPTLKALGAAHNPTGSGWAYPGEFYGESIAAIANRITRR